MKFAKELEQDLVPEWRTKYLDYRQGKKFIKAVTRAINRANGTPVLGLGRRGELPPRTTPSFTNFTPLGGGGGVISSFSPQRSRVGGAAATPGSVRFNDANLDDAEEVDPLRESPAPIARDGGSGGPRPGVLAHTASAPPATRATVAAGGVAAGVSARPVPVAERGGAGGRRDERSRLMTDDTDETNYGSLVPTPPQAESPPARPTGGAGGGPGPTRTNSRRDDFHLQQHIFELPAPAIRVESHASSGGGGTAGQGEHEQGYGKSGGLSAQMAALKSPSVHRLQADSQPHHHALRSGVGSLGSLAAQQRSWSMAAVPSLASYGGGGPGGGGGGGGGVGAGLGPPGAYGGVHRAGTFGRAGSIAPRLRRLFSTASPLMPSGPGRAATAASRAFDISLQNLDVVREKERDFFSFLDGELEKVEGFYKLKEEQAGKRLELLREQLHEMRNRRTEELAELRRRKEEQKAQHGGDGAGEDGEANGKDGAHLGGIHIIDPLKRVLFKPGPNSKALQKMPQTPVFGPGGPLGGGSSTADPDHRDYTRRRRPAPPAHYPHNVPYRTAKRKLKLALQEFYRGLELLKAYALLNRTAFRKLNKKYDKAVNARPPYRYMTEKVNKAWFVNSGVLESHIQSVEDMYARYFEKGNRKVAAGKLRSIASHKPGDQSGSAFCNGLLMGTGLVFAAQGIVYGVELLYDTGRPAVVAARASYVLQIYGGYFLMLYLFFLFCFDCHVWTTNKINYPFVFEFDPRHHLDWRQLSEFPAAFLLLFGVCLWLNFAPFADVRVGGPPSSGIYPGAGGEAMFLWWPVVLVALTVAIIFLPAPIVGHRSRRWFAYSHWRLLLAGFYPVEFRDFFLGDMYCSLTYATCNVELFFCLYAGGAWWSGDMARCSSSVSRLLGFFSALPPIWRAMQCIRRYRDTLNVFPHLANCVKYSLTILAAVALSLYRIQGTHGNLSMFVVVSVLNSVYCSLWDVFMDFSLLQPTPNPHPYLRPILSLKRRWVYYAALFVDPLLRFSWVFYAIFTHDVAHASFVSFLVSMAEVTRRGMWCLLRVENEHSANVAQSKASRDVPLPYKLLADDEADAAVGDPLLMRTMTGEDGSADVVAVPAGGATVTPALSGRLAPPSVGPTGSASGAATSAAGTGGTGGGAGGATPSTLESGVLRRRSRPRADTSGAKSISRIIAEAHRQDFEKKRRPAVGDRAASGLGVSGSGAGPSGEPIQPTPDMMNTADLEADVGVDDDHHESAIARHAASRLHSDDEFDDDEEDDDDEGEDLEDVDEVDEGPEVKDGYNDKGVNDGVGQLVPGAAAHATGSAHGAQSAGGVGAGSPSAGERHGAGNVPADPAMGSGTGSAASRGGASSLLRAKGKGAKEEKED